MMFKQRPMFLALLVAYAVMSGVISAAAQATGTCPLLDSVMTADGFRLSVFGDGGVAPISAPDQVAVMLNFHVDTQMPSCAGDQATILIVDAHDAAIAPPYHVRVNDARITFTDQFALGIGSTRDRMTLSPLNGTVVVLSEDTSNVAIVPLGYSAQIGLDVTDGSAMGDWLSNTAIDVGSLSTLRAMAADHPELALATPTDEQVMTAVQTIAANPPQPVQAPVTAAVPGADQPSQTYGGQPSQSAPSQSPAGGQSSGQTSPAGQTGQGAPGGGQGQGTSSGQSSGGSSGQTSNGNSSGQGSSNGGAGQNSSGGGGQSNAGGQTSGGSGGPTLGSTDTVPRENLCAQLGPGCTPVNDGPANGTNGPSPCNGCEPVGVVIDLNRAPVLRTVPIEVGPGPIEVGPRPIDLDINDRINIDGLPYENIPQGFEPGPGMGN